MIVGFDISTSCVGYTLLSDKGKIIKCSYLKFNKKHSKENKAYDLDLKLLSFGGSIVPQIPINANIYIEDYSTRFTYGKSNAHTIAQLIHFSGMIRGWLNKLAMIPVQYINVQHARKLAGISPKPTKQTDIKKHVYNTLKKRFGKQLPIWYTRRNTVRKETYDASDSLVIALAGYELFKQK